MAELLYDITINLDVYTDCDLDEISKCLALQPSETSTKGVTKSKVAKPPKHNIWTLSEKHVDCLESDGFIAEFLSKYGIDRAKCRAIKAKGKCLIRVFVQSDFARIKFALSREDADALSECGLEVLISILSWAEN